MSKILVSGLVNLETTLKIAGFPIDYAPVHYPFFGVNTAVSGVGFNVSKALTRLGDQVTLLSLTGADEPGALAQAALAQEGISAGGVLPVLPATAQSVILYEPGGRRMIHTDLKDIQEQSYPLEHATQALVSCDLAVLCNINFSRPLLAQARLARKPVASDVHAISDLEDAYNQDFMAAAQILFMSGDRLPSSPEHWALQVMNRFGCEILVIGLGADGALMSVRQERFMERFPAVTTRPVVSTIGAGDALFAAFVHYFLGGCDARIALQKAMLFASYKIGAPGAAGGLLEGARLEALWAQRNSPV